MILNYWGWIRLKVRAFFQRMEIRKLRREAAAGGKEFRGV